MHTDVKAPVFPCTQPSPGGGTYFKSCSLEFLFISIKCSVFASNHKLLNFCIDNDSNCVVAMESFDRSSERLPPHWLHSCLSRSCCKESTPTTTPPPPPPPPTQCAQVARSYKFTAVVQSTVAACTASGIQTKSALYFQLGNCLRWCGQHQHYRRGAENM